MLNADLVTKLFLQLAIIMTSCRIVSYLGRRFLKQTNVVCEMLVGVLLGPSFFGLIFPEFQNWLFPKTPLLLDTGITIPNPSMSILYACSQIGLVLYMFLVGMEFNALAIQKKMKSAGFISLIGIVLPFSLGFFLILFTPDTSLLFNEGFPECYRAFFLGISLSITAFPMMARILEESGISKTSFGTLALAAGSMDDLVAWIMLAGLIAIIKNNIFVLIIALAGTISYIIFLFFVRKKISSLLVSDVRNKQKNISKSYGIVLIILMCCALLTEKIGIYLVFGSFLAGVMMPRGEFAEQIRIRSYDFVSAFLLPLFFVFSGLNTQISLINSPSMWIFTGVILFIAILGKGVGCMLAAKFIGENWRNSATIGTLMNARGLMELIALNIGLELNIITPTLYTILVLMAIITTLLASPLYYWISEFRKCDKMS